MKKYFVAYRVRGESREVLQERVTVVVDALKKAGIDAYCNFFDQNQFEKDKLSARQIMDKAFAKIDESDGLFVLIASKDKSEGQLLEVGYSFAKGKPIVAAVQEDVATHVDKIADKVLRWQDLGDLQSQLEGLRL
jgi:nucleoside 2-deoxyribosyltransferase